MSVTEGWVCTHNNPEKGSCGRTAFIGAVGACRYERQPEECAMDSPGLCAEHLSELRRRNWKSLAVPVPGITPKEKAFAEAAIALYSGPREVPSHLGNYALTRYADYYHIRGVKVTKKVLRDLLDGITDASGEKKSPYVKKGEAPQAYYRCTEGDCGAPALLGVKELPSEARDEKDGESSCPALCLEHFHLLPERTWKHDARPVPGQTEKRMRFAEAACGFYEEKMPRNSLDEFNVVYTTSTVYVGCVEVEKEVLELMLKELES